MMTRQEDAELLLMIAVDLRGPSILRDISRCILRSIFRNTLRGILRSRLITFYVYVSRLRFTRSSDRFLSS